MLRAVRAVRSCCCWAPTRARPTAASNAAPAEHPLLQLQHQSSVSPARRLATGSRQASLVRPLSGMGKPAGNRRRRSSSPANAAGLTGSDGTGDGPGPHTASAPAPRRSKRVKVQPEPPSDLLPVKKSAAVGQGTSSAHALEAAVQSTAVQGNTTANGVLLHDFGDMDEGKVVKRPSATCRTPYIADVELCSDGSTIMAHTPGLDCAGVVSPGRKVWMTRNAPKAGSKQTASTHAVQLGRDLREAGQLVPVGAHPAQAERFVAKALELRLLPQLGDYTTVATQQTFGSTRVDFVLSGYADGSRMLVEVKHVTVADYPAGQVPDGIPKGVRTYTSTAQPYVRTALFPHGTGKKAVGVVSDRAIKHLHHLTQMSKAGQDEAGGLVRCAVVFLVNRSDCAAMRPCQEADMLFAQMVLRASQHGVMILAHDITWQGGRAHWGKALPVVHGADVTSEIDEEHLQRVLHFNATDPRARWKSIKAGAETAAAAAAAAAVRPAAPGSTAGAVVGGVQLPARDAAQAGATTDGTAAILASSGRQTRKQRSGKAEKVTEAVDAVHAAKAPAKPRRSAGV